MNACTAVGFFTDAAHVEHTLAERWDGSNWQIQPSGTATGEFNAVSCSSATFCVAVGNHGNSAELVGVWNGGSWLFPLGSNFNGATSARLNGVSCTADGSCIMAGQTSGRGGSSGFFPLALKLIRGQFFLLNTASPGATDNGLSAVSCTSSGNCLAVGFFQDFKGQQDTLAEQWDGTTWSFESTPNPVGTLPSLNGVVVLVTRGLHGGRELQDLRRHDRDAGRAFNLTRAGVVGVRSAICSVMTAERGRC